MDVNVAFITNRKLDGGKFGNTFPDIVGDLRVGRVLVHDDSSLEKLEILPDDPDRGSKALFGELQGTMASENRDTLFYIHGFNNDFEDSVREGAQLVRNLAANQPTSLMNVVVFSWPSNGKLREYYPDRHDAETSGLGAARAILKFTRFMQGVAPQNACGRKVHLIAHSMGAYVLRNALQQLPKIADYRGPLRLFDQVVLAAADEDTDALELDHKLGALPNLCARLNIYFNNRDVALAVSDRFKGNPDRLGHDGPAHPHAVTQKTVLIDVTTVLPSVVDAGVVPLHDYIRTNDQVLADLRRVLTSDPSELFDASRLFVPHANKFRLLPPKAAPKPSL